MNVTGFTHIVPHNSNRAKYAFISLLTTLVLCIVAMILSKMFWEGNTEWVYSYKYQRNIEIGWPVTLYGWSMWLGIAIVLVLPFLYFMQDWKNPALAINSTSLFVNQQLMRNVFIPFEDIKQIHIQGSECTVVLHTSENVLKQIHFLFKPFVKSNLAQNTIDLSSTFNGGDVSEIAKIIQLKIK